MAAPDHVRNVVPALHVRSDYLPSKGHNRLVGYIHELDIPGMGFRVIGGGDDLDPMDPGCGNIMNNAFGHDPLAPHGAV
jgi:hypothetical protein